MDPLVERGVDNLQHGPLVGGADESDGLCRDRGHHQETVFIQPLDTPELRVTRP